MAAGQPAEAAEEPKEKPLYLVARPELVDPYFRQSVVVMLPARQAPLVVGIIVNKPTRLPLRQLFPEIPGLKDKSDNAYFGGPVNIREMIIVFRSSRVPELATRLFDDICISLDSSLVESLLRDSTNRREHRLFLGRAQWAPAQLQGELLRRDWYTLNADSDLIFSPNHETLWRTLLNRARPGTEIKYQLPFGLLTKPVKWGYR